MTTIPPAGDDRKGGRRPDLLPKHRADLENSGLSDEQVGRCGFYSESDPAAVARLLGWKRPARNLGPCLCVPFPGPDGAPTGYVRVKPDRPRTRDGKVYKYESPRGHPNRAYLPPATRAALTDPAVPLILTEGEKKSAKADQDGFACVGLVGVYGWQKKRPVGPDGRKRGPRELIPDLTAVAWAGRRVYVVFDSDIAEKPPVRRAEWHLSGVLRAAGADVRAVRLPAGPGGGKVGLDDFLVARGPAALRELLARATPVEPPAATPPRSRWTFAVGDRVSPSDLGNVGTVTAVLPGGKYRVFFEGEDGTAEKVFAGSELTPLGRRGTKPGTPPVPPAPFRPFPVEALPAPLRPFVRAVAAAIPCDPAAVALPALVACGAAVGAARVLAIKNAWTEPPILWGGLVAPSGSVKSPPVEHALLPLVRIDLELRKESNKEFAAFKEAERARKEEERESAGGKGRKSGEADTGGAKPPPKRRCVVQDITIESLAVVLADNPKGVLVYRDELASWFGSLTRYSKTDTTADWLALFHARTLTVDRKTGDKLTVAVPNAAASLVGTIQPKVLTRAFTSEFRASGGAARLLLVMPPVRQKVWTDDDLPPDVAAGYAAVLRRLRALAPGEGPAPVSVPFAAEARRRWGEFVNEWGRVTSEAAEEDDDLAAAYSKIEGYAARFALLHHLVTADGTSSPGVVGLDDLEAGIALARWFANETERVYAALVEDEASARLRKTVERVRQAGGRVTVRALQKTNSRRYPTAGSAEAELDALVAAGWGWWEEARPPGGGHPLREFVLRPTPDTSDTRRTAADAPTPPTSDARLTEHGRTPEMTGETVRVSEVSGVGAGSSPAEVGHAAEPVGGSSVGTPPPEKRTGRRFRSDDRPPELRAAR